MAACAESAFAYRPFESTDADVVQPRTVEIELGIAGIREGRRTDALAPKFVVNVGLVERFEAIVEGDVVYPEDEPVRLEDAAVGAKWLALPGSLQGVGDLPSLAVEALALLPTAPGERHAGPSWSGSPRSSAPGSSAT
jgi:hypothetical protein